MGEQGQALGNENQKRGKIFVVAGASDEFAKVEVFPALWDIYRNFEVPQDCHFIAYAPSKLTTRDLRNRCIDFMKDVKSPRGRDLQEKFWKSVKYISGSYKDFHDAQNLSRAFEDIEKDYHKTDRIFFMALPRELFKTFLELVSDHFKAPTGKTTIVFEKPFGNDLTTFDELETYISSKFSEDEICRLDHHLTLEMTKSMMQLRFANIMFSALWNKDHIQAVLLNSKEKHGITGQSARQFDRLGFIRHIMQSHLFHVMTLIGMEKPESWKLEHVKEAQIDFMKSICPIDGRNLVLGQYKAKPNAKPTEEAASGYTDDAAIPGESKTATYATVVLFVDNERWEGVPFIMQGGKATNKDIDEVRVQFKGPSAHCAKVYFPKHNIAQNEVVFQFKPESKILLRTTQDHPGLECELDNHELDLFYESNFKNSRKLGAFPSILLGMLKGNEQTHMIRKEELKHSWSLFTPLLNKIELDDPVAPTTYPFGSPGPKESLDMCVKHGFSFSDNYPW